MNLWIICDNTLDMSFGIRFENKKPMIGDKIIKIDDDDIVIDDVTYNGTPGLWNLITQIQPDDYSLNDYKQYKDILYQTHALHQGYNPQSSQPRSSKSIKWKKILGPIWDEFKEEGLIYDQEPFAGDGLTMTRNPVKKCRVLLKKKGRCYDVRTTPGNGLFLSPCPGDGLEDGLFVKRGSKVYDGDGLLLGNDSPFRNIPVLGWLL